MRTSVVSALLLVTLIGCSRAPALHVKRGAPAVLPSGWTMATSSDSKVKVGVASGWRFGVDRMDMASAMGTGETPQSTDPQIQQMMQQMDKESQEDERRALEKMEKKGILIHIINSGKPIFDEARTRYVVQRYSQDSNWSFEEATEKERGQFAFKPKSEEVQLPIGKAVRLFASEELRNGSTIHRISYLAIDGKDLYVLRFITQESKDVIESIAKDVASTLRIVPGT